MAAAVRVREKNRAAGTSVVAGVVRWVASSGATVDLLPGGRVLFDGVSGAGTSGITPWTDTVRFAG